MIVHGTKLTIRRIGHVADFCSICRQPRVMRLSRVGLSSHIYFISFGEGKLVGHKLECLHCSVEYEADPLRYASTEKRASADVEATIQRTLPNLRTLHAERLTIEDDVLKNPYSLDPETRLELIIEPFRWLNPMAEKRFETSTQMDKEAGIGCLAALIVPVVILYAASLLSPPVHDNVWIAAGIIGGALFLYTLIQIHFAPGRYVRRKLVPLVSRALYPLQPSKDELSICLARCKTAGMKIGRYVKLDGLVNELAAMALRKH